ncbi:MAG TPA: fumarate reductase/succinate dehydrogenase flavoprotein subunit, partial [Gemmatimonadaceae bacterium]|nr:fumarate reductase/succinate dehydrogenase flavoprotein subunit [Gemmatimonadaceae bacterium]
NRLGASALMQGLADGYFVLQNTLGDYLASTRLEPVNGDAPEVKAAVADVAKRTSTLLGIKGKRTVASFHRELGKVMWEYCGMARDASGLRKALEIIPQLREEFWRDVRVPGEGAELNQTLEHAGRVADFLELGELMCRDALHREESCGGHFRTEHQTPDGEALRDDERFAYVAAWEWAGEGKPQVLNKEPLVYENIKLSQRSYK